MTGITAKNGSSSVVNTSITYKDPSSSATSTQVYQWTTGGVTYTYTYDNRGNITSVSDGTNTTSYVYDSLDQLTRENNQAAGKTWVYTYDNGGNILSKTEYAYTTGALGTALDTISYGYGDSTWKDLLTSYDGQELSTDNIGNLTNDGTWTYNWQHGRQLAKMLDPVDYMEPGMREEEVTFAYNAEGQRIQKIYTETMHFARPEGTYTSVNSKTTKYFYAGDTLTQVVIDDLAADITTQMSFTYDATGPMSVNYDGVEYFYLKNAQGDITGLVDSTGTQVVTYTYDAWGKLLSTTGTKAYGLGADNPFRYRGYMYDQETGLYYLNSRYYNPATGRFINADNALSGTGETVYGYNMFAYCFSNPVNMDDPSGSWPKWIETAAKVVAVAAVVVSAVVLVAVVTAGTGGLAAAAAGVSFGTACGGLVGGIANEKKGESFINGWVGGAVNGFVQATGTAMLGPAGTIAGGGVGSGLGTATTESLNNIGRSSENKKTPKVILNESLQSAKIGTIMSTLTAGIGYGIDFTESPLGYNSWIGTLKPGEGIAPLTPGFREMMKGFFGAVDDALVYVFCE